MTRDGGSSGKIDVDPVALRVHSNTLSRLSSDLVNVGAAAGYHKVGKGLPVLFRGVDGDLDDIAASMIKLIKATGNAFSRTSTSVRAAAENYVDSDEKSRQRTLAVVKDLPL